MTAAGHGTHNRYCRGCRCERCAQAHSVYMKRHRMGAMPTYVDATGTHRRIQALACLGYGLKDQSVRAGKSGPFVGQLLTRTIVHEATAAMISRLYDELSMTPAPAHDKYTRHATNRIRRIAREKGWAPPLAWDDEAIDDPSMRPAEHQAIEESDYVDEVAVARALAGHRTPLNATERAVVVRAWQDAGRPLRQLELTLGINAHRELRKDSAA